MEHGCLVLRTVLPLSSSRLKVSGSGADTDVVCFRMVVLNFCTLGNNSKH